MFLRLVSHGLAAPLVALLLLPVPNLWAESGTPVPPPMPSRAIQPGVEAVAGTQVVLNDRGTNFTLFIPTNFVAAASGEVALTMHFHSAIWFGIQEHLRRGCTNPIVCFYPGEGSTVYRLPFEDRERLGRWLGLVEAELIRRGSATNTHISRVDISSFSAGYGAVREIVKVPAYRKLLGRVVLCDSLYGSLDEDALKTGQRKVAAEHIEPWLPLAKEAAAGEKDFVLTVSAIPTRSYACSSECADALAAAVGARKAPVSPGSVPATLELEYPLVARAELGRFRIWYYGGTNAMAHMTHARHLAEVWQALDAAR